VDQNSHQSVKGFIVSNPNSQPYNTQGQGPAPAPDNNLLIGTRPQIGGRVIMTGAAGFDGYEIVEYRGMAWGISVRAKDVGQDCAMGCKNITGGELSSYSQLGHESRQRAVDLMLQMAAHLGANGIINVEFQLSGASQGASEVVVFGTAVIIKPIVNYVPVGAIGNILFDIEKSISDKP